MSAPSSEHLLKACIALAAADPALNRAHQEIGLPTWRTAPAEYRTLARTVTYQQISTTAAAQIWARVETALPGVKADNVLMKTEDDLRILGLSRPKIRHMKSIAGALIDGTLDLKRISQNADGVAARDELLAVKGIGPWTAELFCLYALGDMDAFPTADLGLMESYRQLRGDQTRQSREMFTQTAEAWRPWRGVAAHLLWDWLNAERAKSRRDSQKI